MKPPIRCPAPDHCECVSRSWGDPEPEEPCSVWCMGLRTTNEFPGKEEAIKNEPSDVIVFCSLIGSHSDQPGPKTVISNVPDQGLILEVLLKGLHKLGILVPTLFSVVYMNDLEDDVLAVLNKDRRAPCDVGQVMWKIDCSCEELYRHYGERLPPTPELERLIHAHTVLGHQVDINKYVFTGERWDKEELR